MSLDCTLPLAVLTRKPMCSIRIRNARDPDDPFSGYSGECDSGGIQRCMYDWRDERCRVVDMECGDFLHLCWDASKVYEGHRWREYTLRHHNEYAGCRNTEDAINRGVL